MGSIASSTSALTSKKLRLLSIGISARLAPLGNAETRIALALNTGTLHVEDGKVKVSVPCTWPKQSLSNVGLPGLLDIRVQEGLFWILEQEGWIYPYTAVWEADLPVN